MKAQVKEKFRRETPTERLNAEIDELSGKTSLDGWNAFIRNLQVPGDVAPAIMSARGELLRLVPPRELSADEHKVYLDLIGGLLETNAALRRHAEQVSQIAEQLRPLVKGFAKTCLRLEGFARFEKTDDVVEDEEE